MNADASHSEQLRDEMRLCPQCGYEIANPMTDRCPRCFAPVARREVNCGSCTHQGNCEFAHLQASLNRTKQH